jgi:hypothetical protein
MGEPPVVEGAVQVKATLPLPGVARRLVGAPGTVRGVAKSAFDAGPVPARFVARTVKE